MGEDERGLGAVALNVEAWTNPVILNMPLSESDAYNYKLPSCIEKGSLVVDLVYKIHRSTVDNVDSVNEEILQFTPKEHVRIVG